MATSSKSRNRQILIGSGACHVGWKAFVSRFENFEKAFRCQNVPK